MLYLVIKGLITAILVVAISEISKRSTLIGGILASIPLTSVLALIWLYIDKGDAEQVSRLSVSIFWLVIPSLSLFIILPVLMRKGLHFGAALPIGLVVMVGLYLATIWTLGRIGVSL